MCVGVGHVSSVPNQTEATTELSYGYCAKKMPVGGANQNALELPYL